MIVLQLDSGATAEIIEAGSSDASQQQICDRLALMQPAVVNVSVVCKTTPCRGKASEHALRATFLDGRTFDIDKGMFFVLVTESEEERYMHVMTREQLEAAYDVKPKASKKERWHTRGWNGAIDAVMDEIGADISPMLREAITDLREE